MLSQPKINPINNQYDQKTNQEKSFIVGEVITASGHKKTMVLRESASKAIRFYYSKNNSKEVKDLYEKVITEVERELISVTMETFRGNQTKAANALGINRGTLRKKISKLDKHKKSI